MSTTPTRPEVHEPEVPIISNMPANWSFEIYEDSPEEEAANLMEHSTLVLDLSSDEKATKAKYEDRGKENTPPDGYEPSYASRPSPITTTESTEQEGSSTPTRVKKTDLIRRKTREMDDGVRSALSELDAEPFFPEGLDKNSVTVVNLSPYKASSDIKDDVYGYSLPSKVLITDSSQKSTGRLVPQKRSRSNKFDMKEEIAVFDDSSDADVNPELVTVEEPKSANKDMKYNSDSENATPQDHIA